MNMLPLLPKLTETEIALIKEAMRRYDPEGSIGKPQPGRPSTSGGAASPPRLGF